MKSVSFDEEANRHYSFETQDEPYKMKEQIKIPIVPVMGYMISSALLLIINKAVVLETGCPNFVLLTQMIATSFTVWTLGMLGFIEVDALSVDKLKQFWLVPTAFMATIFANIKILQNTNVETFIVFRASTPIVLSMIEPFFLSRGLPSHKSFVSLIILFMGAVGYTMAEPGEFTVDSVFWVYAWYSLFTFDQIFIKHTIGVVKMTTWGRVYYTNLLPIIPFLYMFYASGDEFEKITQTDINKIFTPLLMLSWVLGTCISFFAFITRHAVSATLFTVIGNVCKFLTILVNFAVWDKHATDIGVVFLIICIMAAYLYEPAKKLEPDEHKLLIHDMWHVGVPRVTLGCLGLLVGIAVWKFFNVDDF